MSLFEEFSSVSKQEWLERVRAELKTRDPAELAWEASEDLVISPFQHHSDAPSQPIHLGTHREDNQWQIGEYIPVEDDPLTNKLLLKGLQEGVNAPLLVWPEEKDSINWTRLMADVHPAYVSLHFDWSQSPFAAKDLSALHTYLGSFERSEGSIHYELDPEAIPTDQWREMNTFIQQQPHWRLLGVDARAFYRGDDATVEELYQSLTLATQYLDQLGDRGVPIEQINQQLHVHFLIGTSYLLNISKLRAWQVLWANVLAHYDATNRGVPPIIAHCLPPVADDTHTNMIRAATQTMTAAIGGAQRIYVAPAEGGVGTSASRRTARNVQHLLQLESGLDRVVDPAAGSYYLENMTKGLAEKVWAKFVAAK